MQSALTIVTSVNQTLTMNFASVYLSLHLFMLDIEHNNTLIKIGKSVKLFVLIDIALDLKKLDI
jgi:hypothetical protein